MTHFNMEPMDDNTDSRTLIDLYDDDHAFLDYSNKTNSKKTSKGKKKKRDDQTQGLNKAPGQTII